MCEAMTSLMGKDIKMPTDLPQLSLTLTNGLEIFCKIQRIK